MIANETTLHKRPNYTKTNKYKSPYGLQQWAKPIPHSQLKTAEKGPEMTNVKQFKRQNM